MRPIHLGRQADVRAFSSHTFVTKQAQGARHILP
jgi:hypothetical protein